MNRSFGKTSRKASAKERGLQSAALRKRPKLRTSLQHSHSPTLVLAMSHAINHAPHADDLLRNKFRAPNAFTPHAANPA